jgi:hypothetical protein
MGYVQTTIQAVTVVGLPLFGLSFALVWWALYRGRVEGETVEDLQRSLADFGKQQKDKEKRQKIDPALGKWFSFGGGFYGLVALYTWILMEWSDVGSFVRAFIEFDLHLRIDELIQWAIRLFINSIMNFVWAIVWPVYWLQKANNPWIWFAVAYAGYWLGIQSAQRAAGKRWEGE